MFMRRLRCGALVEANHLLEFRVVVPAIEIGILVHSASMLVSEDFAANQKGDGRKCSSDVLISNVFLL
jgi:hypothetical protein